jgi:hypothetical protein
VGALTERSSADILFVSTASLEVGQAAFSIANTRGSIPVWFLDILHNALDLFLLKGFRMVSSCKTLADIDKDVQHGTKRLFHSHVVMVLFQFCIAEIGPEGRERRKDFGVLVIDGFELDEHRLLS